MTALPYIDFFDPTRHADSSPQVVKIYQSQFPHLYRAVDRGGIRTATGSAIQLRGDTLITYRSAIRRIYGKYFRHLDAPKQREILSILDVYSNTAEKRIQFWDGLDIVNNHQIGNMMPFPSGMPSLNSLRADVGAPPGADKLFDYFDRFLSEVESYYAESADYRPISKLQVAIHYYRGYFDFFGTYEKFVEDNLLQDFVGKDLWTVTDFREYLHVAKDIIDSRGKRFADSSAPC
jgi:hypothetical protein